MQHILTVSQKGKNLNYVHCGLSTIDYCIVYPPKNLNNAFVVKYGGSNSPKLSRTLFATKLN